MTSHDMFSIRNLFAGNLSPSKGNYLFKKLRHIQRASVGTKAELRKEKRLLVCNLLLGRYSYALYLPSTSSGSNHPSLFSPPPTPYQYDHLLLALSQ